MQSRQHFSDAFSVPPHPHKPANTAALVTILAFPITVQVCLYTTTTGGLSRGISGSIVITVEVSKGHVQAQLSYFTLNFPLPFPFAVVNIMTRMGPHTCSAVGLHTQPWCLLGVHTLLCLYQKPHTTETPQVLRATSKICLVHMGCTRDPY